METPGVADAWVPAFSPDVTRWKNLVCYLDVETPAGREPLARKWIRARFARGRHDQQKGLSKDLEGRVSLDLSWAFGAMAEEDAPHSTSQQIMSTISALNDLLKKRRFVDIGVIFGIIDPKRLSPELMLTLLRVTFPVRELVPGWYQLLRRIKSELDRRHLDTKSLLVGLL